MSDLYKLKVAELKKECKKFKAKGHLSECNKMKKVELIKFIEKQRKSPSNKKSSKKEEVKNKGKKVVSPTPKKTNPKKQPSPKQNFKRTLILPEPDYSLIPEKNMEDIEFFRSEYLEPEGCNPPSVFVDFLMLLESSDDPLLESLNESEGFRYYVAQVYQLGLHGIKLNFSNVYLEFPSDVASLVYFIKNIPKITELEFTNKKFGFGDQGLVILSNYLLNNRTIECLNVSKIGLGDMKVVPDEGILAISQVLEYNPILEYLKLSDNKIGLAGINALAEALTKNKTLKTLMLDNTDLDDEKLKILFTALRNNNSLETLNLFMNKKITIDGVTGIIEDLKQNTGLKLIFFGLGLRRKNKKLFEDILKILDKKR